MDDLGPPKHVATEEPVLLASVAASPPQPDREGLAEPANVPELALLIEHLERSISSGVASLLAELREKASLDHFREEQIDRLHAELQTYKNDLVSKGARQLLLGIVRLHDDLARSADGLRRKRAEELTQDFVFRQLADFQDDIELLLAQHGVEPFAAMDEAFDPRRQTVARTVPTADPSLVGQVAERVRPGFEQGETLLQRERVAVYVIAKDTDPLEQGVNS